MLPSTWKDMCGSVRRVLPGYGYPEAQPAAVGWGQKGTRTFEASRRPTSWYAESAICILPTCILWVLLLIFGSCVLLHVLHVVSNKTLCWPRLKYCFTKRIPWTLEQPANSILPFYRPLQDRYQVFLWILATVAQKAGYMCALKTWQCFY